MTYSASATASAALLRSIRRLSNKKFRDQQGAFLAEGPQSVREALRWARVRSVVVDPAADVDEFVALARDVDVPIYTAGPDDLAHITDAVTTQGVVAVVEQFAASTIPDNARLVAVCAHVRDPGNAGTIIRCADAFGADAVILSSESVDIYNPKTVRASVGSLFHLPVITGADLAQTLPTLREAGFDVWGASAGETTIDEVNFGAKVAWVFGNEAWGLPEEIRLLCTQTVSIPMWGKAESLNVATAAGICLFTTARVLRGANPS